MCMWILLLLAVVLLAAAFVLITYSKYVEAFHIPGARSSAFFDYFFVHNPALRYEKIYFKASNGESIGGIQLIPESLPKGLVVLTHGYNRTIENYLPEGKMFVNAGFHVIMFDGVGTGLSGGNSIVGLTQHILDMEAVLDQIAQDQYLSQLPLFLYGHSWGGFAANAVSCIKTYPIKGIISVAAFSDALDTIRPTIRKRYGFLSNIVFRLASFFTFCSFGKAASYTSAKGLAKANCPALVCHSYDDAVVNFEDSFAKMQIELQGKPTVKFMELDGRNHNIVTPPEIDKEQLALQKRIAKDSAPDKALFDRLWALQIQIDETLLYTFIKFYEQCL